MSTMSELAVSGVGNRQPGVGVRLLLVLMIAVGALPAGASAQAPGSVRTIFVAPSNGTDRTPQGEEVRRRVVARLGHAARVRLVADERSADAVLRVDAVVWPGGAVSLNPRSGTPSVRNYEGYASAELVGASGIPLWSYLATPGRFRFAAIADDLGDQLGEALAGAFRAGLVAAPFAAMSGATVLPGGPLRVAGATFPAPLYTRWFESYAAQGGAALTYESVGSSAGVKALDEGKIEMAASDLPGAADNARAKNLRFPTVVGAVVPVYNLPGLGGVVRFTPEVLAAIFSGKITRWNDARIRLANKGLRLPDAAITVVHRSDGSGTTFVWTSFLATTPAWGLGAGDTVAWPVGVGAAGSVGVAAAVRETPNAIGYVEMTFAIQRQLEYGAVSNPAGHFVRASLANLSLAAQAAEGTGGLLLNGRGEEVYPVASFTSFLLPETSADAERRRALVEFLRWMLTAGQKQCSGLGYAPLPREMVRLELKELDAVR